MPHGGRHIHLACLAVLLFVTSVATTHLFRGRYTREIPVYETLVPRKVDAEGSFISYDVPHFYNLAEARKRRSSSAQDDPHVRFALLLGGKEHVVELWPNYGLLSPGLMIERRRRDVRRADIRRVRREQCHYLGKVSGRPTSRVALSACDEGLAGFVHTGEEHFLLEPAAERWPDASGRHLHLAYQHDESVRSRRRNDRTTPYCGVGDDWRRAWEDRILWEMNMNPDISRFKPKHRDSPLVHYIAVLVVADKKFIDFHRDHDVESYILTLMNMVSDYYHDASVGRYIEVPVVRMLYLEKEDEELDLSISRDAHKTLESFKGWSQRINPVDSSHPNHHDIAILMTRHDICGENMANCSVMGLAPMTSACKPDQSASIIEDSGLQTGVTITHEIGHMLGCSHDNRLEGDVAGCEPFASDGTAYVMSAIRNPHTSSWSMCSKKFIRNLLDTSLGECLLDEPQGHPFSSTGMPAGAMYDASYQCRDLFGLKEVCSNSKEDHCKQLWCKTSNQKCVSMDTPAAEGTKCGEGRWCYSGECVEAGSRPGAVDGGWGSWSEWSQCTRSCGGGVEAKERLCSSPAPRRRGRYCSGERKRFRVCNVEPCDAALPTFRAEQCSAHDDKPFQGQMYKWKPYVREAGNECELLCYNEASFFASLAPVVRDGTPCRKGTRDLCVGGVCTHMGCDWVLGSDAVEDACGECGGDGSHCRQVDSLYTEPHGDQYVQIATVPAYSYNVRVEEVAPSSNTLAASTKDGKFYINDNFKEYPDGEYKFGSGVVGIYTHPETEREVIRIKGPTSENLSIYVVFCGQRNPGVRVSYYQRTEAACNTSYSWEFLEWSPCSRRCEGGTQVSRPSCVEAKAGVVSGSFCSLASKPEPQRRVCNMQKCAARWHTGGWGPCSGCGDRLGTQRRVVACVSENPMPEGDLVPVEEERCSGTKPNNTRECTNHGPCVSEPSWTAKEGSSSTVSSVTPSTKADRMHSMMYYLGFKHTTTTDVGSSRHTVAESDNTTASHLRPLNMTSYHLSTTHSTHPTSTQHASSTIHHTSASSVSSTTHRSTTRKIIILKHHPTAPRTSSTSDRSTSINPSETDNHIISFLNYRNEKTSTTHVGPSEYIANTTLPSSSKHFKNTHFENNTELYTTYSKNTLPSVGILHNATGKEFAKEDEDSVDFGSMDFKTTSMHRTTSSSSEKTDRGALKEGSTKSSLDKTISSHRSTVSSSDDALQETDADNKTSSTLRHQSPHAKTRIHATSVSASENTLPDDRTSPTVQRKKSHHVTIQIFPTMDSYTSECDTEKETKNMPTVIVRVMPKRRVTLSSEHASEEGRETSSKNMNTPRAPFATATNSFSTRQTNEKSGSTASYTNKDNVIDTIQPNQFILLQAPLIAAIPNISERSQAEMGNDLFEELDTSKEKIYHGKEALEKIREIKNEQKLQEQQPV